MGYVAVFMRPYACIVFAGAMLTAVCWFLVPLAAPAIWTLTLSFGAMSLVALTGLGIVRLAQRFANPF